MKTHLILDNGITLNVREKLESIIHSGSALMILHDVADNKPFILNLQHLVYAYEFGE